MDDKKNFKDTLLKSLFSAIATASDAPNSDGTSQQRGPVNTLRDIFGSLASFAGKGKDEIVQMISREIGQAVAGVIKEPVTQILQSKKICITLELVDRENKVGPKIKSFVRSTRKK